MLTLCTSNFTPYSSMPFLIWIETDRALTTYQVHTKYRTRHIKINTIIKNVRCLSHFKIHKYDILTQLACLQMHHSGFCSGYTLHLEPTCSGSWQQSPHAVSYMSVTSVGDDTRIVSSLSISRQHKLPIVVSSISTKPKYIRTYNINNIDIITELNGM